MKYLIYPLFALFIFVGAGCSNTNEQKRVSDLENQVLLLKQQIHEPQINNVNTARLDVIEVEQPKQPEIVKNSTKSVKAIPDSGSLTNVAPIILAKSPIVVAPEVLVSCNGSSYKEGTAALLSCQQLMQQQQAKLLEQQKIDTQVKIEICKAEKEKNKIAFTSVINQMTQLNYTKLLSQLDTDDPCSKYTVVSAIIMCLDNHKQIAYDAGVKTRTNALRENDLLLETEYLKCLSK